MFYFRDLVFYRDSYVLLFVTDQHFSWQYVGKVEISTEHTELDRAEPAGGQASGLAGLVGLTSSMGTFFVGQDFRRHPSRSIVPQPIAPLDTCTYSPACR